MIACSCPWLSEVRNCCTCVMIDWCLSPIILMNYSWYIEKSKWGTYIWHLFAWLWGGSPWSLWFHEAKNEKWFHRSNCDTVNRDSFCRSSWYTGIRVLKRQNLWNKSTIWTRTSLTMMAIFSYQTKSPSDEKIHNLVHRISTITKNEHITAKSNHYIVVIITFHWYSLTFLRDLLG